MRILMLGNSFTYYNDMPSMLAEITGAEVIPHTRGGAYLAEQLNPETEMGTKTLAALDGSQSWDYVILQGYSSEPVLAKESFLQSVAGLCEKIHAIQATPLLYSTWAYQKDSAVMQEMTEKHGISYDVMYAQLASVYREAAEQNDAVVADVGRIFYERSAKRNLYTEDGKHPNEEGSRIAAETLAAAIAADQKKKKKIVKSQAQPTFEPDDQRLRVLYLYQILLRHTDPEHPLSTNQIRAIMEKEYGIYMHRTTVPIDVSLLQAAGVPIQARRSRVMLYHMEETRFELAELKILIDAVESSKFITEKKSRTLVEKLTSLTSERNAEKLKRNLETAGRVKSGNEKGYYIVDAINEAINTGKQISLFYTDFDANKQVILRNDGKPYTVSPYKLIWNGDYYYLVGWYHEKARVSIFRVDRILTQPEILEENAVPMPADFDISRYTSEVFRMYDTEKIRTVTLCCENEVMKGVIDRFGPDVPVRAKNKTHFMTKVNVCTSPTFYAWVFQWCGAVKITAPKSVVTEYQEMLKRAIS